MTDASNLPGAFFFFILKGGSVGKEGSSIALAYDPDIKAGTTLKSLQAKYFSNDGFFPYYETFAALPLDGSRSPLLTKDSRSFWSGKFGGLKRSEQVRPWPLTDFPDGVMLTGWNQQTSSGMFTTSLGKRFESSNQVNARPLLKGPGESKNLVYSNAVKTRGYAQEVYLISYACDSSVLGDLGWETAAFDTVIPKA